ncbi:MAG TPA: BTAD domain-containing putative transcriptional regulator [Chloroflexota bacterium]|nr:BTAD domain-containing putative transcriptional regulator [Chloroflexota bacterium]
MASLEINLFGVLSLERGVQPLPPFPSRKARDLLAYLLLDHRALYSREHLADVFWPELDGDKARHCLNTTLWRLRGVLGPAENGAFPYLRADAERIGFNPASDFRLDVAEFEVACRNAERAGLHSPDQRALWDRTSVSLYRADLLTDCYDDWCLVARERLQQLFMRALGRLLEYHQQQRDYDTAAAYGQRILTCDPLREQVHRQLIQLYLEAGNAAGALRQYERCKEAVHRELGTDLMPETRALLPRLLGATGSPHPPVSIRTGPGLPGAHAGAASGKSDHALSDLQDAVALMHRARLDLAAATRILGALQRQTHDKGLGLSLRPCSGQPDGADQAAPLIALSS